MWSVYWVVVLLRLAETSDISQLLPKGTQITSQELETVRSILSYLKFNPKNMRREGKMKQKLVDKLLANIPQTSQEEQEPIFDANKDVEDYLFDGDILLNVEQAHAIVDSINAAGTKKPNKIREKRQYNPYQTLWNKNKPIYYTMQGFGSLGSQVIRQAAEFWTQMSCLTFAEHPWASPRIRFVPMQGCWSNVGRQAGWNSQDISLGIGCQTFAAAAHEIGHALGYYHTQSRPDRDNYVAVNFNNIPLNKQSNFIKFYDELGTSRHVGYDFGSIMQYSAYAFAANPFQPTVLAKDPRYQSTMGRREKPSFGDIKGINSIYKCQESCKTLPNCQNYGIVNSKTCNSCICPPQFTGTDCVLLNRGSASSCNGQILQARANWTSFKGQLESSNNGYMEDCHWLIYAPPKKRIQLRLVNISAQYCDSSCSSQAIEINPGNFDLTGMRFCCSNSVGTSVESLGQVMAISGFARSGTVEFDVQFAAL